MVYEFQSAVGLESNGKKATGIFIGIARKSRNEQVQLGPYQINIRHGMASDRMLGNYFQGNGKSSATNSVIKKQVQNILRKLEYKQVVDKTTQYITNAVLYAQVAYLWKTLHLSDSMLNWIDSETCKIMRKKAGLTKSTPKSQLYMIYELENIRHTHLNDQLTRFMTHTSTPGIPQTLCQIQLQQLQSFLGATKHPFYYGAACCQLAHSTLPKMGQLLKSAHKAQFHLEPNHSTAWNFEISLSGTPIIDLIQDLPLYSQVRPIMANGKLLYLEQMLSYNCHMVISFPDLQKRFPQINNSFRAQYQLLFSHFITAPMNNNIDHRFTPMAPNPFVYQDIEEYMYEATVKDYDYIIAVYGA